MRKTDFMGLDSKGRMAIRLSVPLPPSDNKLTFTMMVGKGRYPKRILTEEARACQMTVKQSVASLALMTDKVFREDVKYTCVIHVFFEKVENAGWPDKANSRYKQLDATNRIKLVTDAVSTAIGIDDRHHFSTYIIKREDPEDPRIMVIIREQEPRHGQEDHLRV